MRMREVRVSRMEPLGPWTAGELSKALAELPPNTPVILSSDAEGNQHKPLLEVEDGFGSVSIDRGFADVDLEADQRAVLLIPYD
jgi:hypothetical protein